MTDPDESWYAAYRKMVEADHAALISAKAAEWGRILQSFRRAVQTMPAEDIRADMIEAADFIAQTEGGKNG